MACAKLLISMLLCVATVYAVNLGQPCANNDACDTANAHCMAQYEGCENGRCFCNHDYYQSSVTSCRLRLMPGDTCTNDNTGDLDCGAGTMGSTCENGQCACPDNRQNIHTANNIRYCYGANYGGACDDHSDCLTRTLSGLLGICDAAEGTCACADHATRAGESCRLGTNGEPCPNNGLECDEDLGLSCNAEDVCACAAGEKWHEGRCVDDEATRAAVGEVCDDDDEVEARVCDAGIWCARCPGDANTVETTCKEPAGGASGVSATITSVLGAATFVTLKMFL